MTYITRNLHQRALVCCWQNEVEQTARWAVQPESPGHTRGSSGNRVDSVQNLLITPEDKRKYLGKW